MTKKTKIIILSIISVIFIVLICIIFIKQMNNKHNNQEKTTSVESQVANQSTPQNLAKEDIISYNNENIKDITVENIDTIQEEDKYKQEKIYNIAAKNYDKNINKITIDQQKDNNIYITINDTDKYVLTYNKKTKKYISCLTQEDFDYYTSTEYDPGFNTKDSKYK